MARRSRLLRDSNRHGGSNQTIQMRFAAMIFCIVAGVVWAYLLFPSFLGSVQLQYLPMENVNNDLASFGSTPSSFGPNNVTLLNGPTGKKTGATTFQLAHQESFGFFDDIPEYQWRRAQEIHSKLFPNYFDDLHRFSSGPNDKGNIEKLAPSKNWNGANFQEEFHCPLAQRLPTNSQADGPKWVCDPHRLRDVPDCLVYSFGSNGKAEFEKGIHDEIGPHCEIHTFDPVKWNQRNGDFATALKGYATFHQWGLGTKEEEARGGNMRTLTSIMKDLGHLNRTVHIFKIDCEWCEWFTHKQWLEHDLRQILVETHNAPMPNAQDFFFDLHDAGYVIFSKEANYENGAGGVEFAFLKLSMEFFGGKLYKST